MSMKTHAVEDYGLYITEDDLQEYADKNDLDVNELLFDIGNYYSDADGECFIISKDEYESFCVNEWFCIASLNKFPTLFEQAYKNKEEALQELKDNYSKYLSKDFDYDGKFIHYIGTVFGQN